VQELAAQRFGEPVDGVLTAAVGGLKRNAAGAERGPDLHDDAPVARPHPGQGGHGAVHEPQVGHLGDPPELLGRGLGERGENRGERHVDPHVDRPEGGFDLLGRTVDLGKIRHVGRYGESGPAGPLDVTDGAFQPGAATRDQRDAVPAPGELLGRGPADAGARSGDDNRLSHVASFAGFAPATRGPGRETTRRGMAPG
jgi:hypothetical protein